MLPSLARSCALGLAAVLACLLGGCLGQGNAPKTGFYLVRSAEADFFKLGPAQAFGPDLTLKKGDRVTMLDRQFGFSRVLADNGLSGFVANDDIEPAPVHALPRIAAPTRKAGPAGINARSRQPGGPLPRLRPSEIETQSGDPLFNVNDVPLPEGDPLKPAKPSFRALPRPRSTTDGSN